MNNYYEGYTGNEFMKETNMEGMTEAVEPNMMHNEMPMGQCCNPCGMPVSCEPVYECPQERVCHKYINYEVPHIMPCNTRVINHHVYKHTYRPCYSCCEENVVCNVYGPKCC